MDAWGWAAAGGGVAILFLLGLAVFARDRTRSGPEAGGDSNPDLLLGDMTDPLSEGLPGGSRDQEQVSPLLARAGMYGSKALAEYRAARAVFVLIPLFAAAAAALAVEPRQIVYVVGAGAVLAALGYSLPRVYVAVRGAERTREIERGLPLFADMLSITLLAGQGLPAALKRVNAQLRDSFPQLSEELGIVSRQAELLNLHAAFEQWADRSQSAEVRNFALLLGQCQRLGNDITTALLEYSTHLRSETRQRADARAQRASFWMLFPTIFCLWIPAAVIIVAPVYFEFSEKRAKTREQLEKTNTNNAAGKILGKTNSKTKSDGNGSGK